MKKSLSSNLQTTVVFLIIISLSIPASSILLPTQNNTTAFILDNENIRITTDQKIAEVLSIIDENLIMKYLQFIVGFGPRLTGSYGCEKAAEYIYNQFTNMQLVTRYQNWTGRGNRHYPYLYTSQNIEATLPGTNTNDTSSIIFNAHYDSVAQSPGANDDGSGTAAVLAAAYALSHFDFHRTVKFVTFSGEEIGLVGSRVYTKEAYEQNERILVEINADMIGYDEGSRKMTVTATEDVGWVADIFESINMNYSIGLNISRREINRVHHGASGSDYAVFLPYGWETVCCWQGTGDPNFHTPQDDLSNVNISYLVNTTRIIAATLAYLADVLDPPPQVRITSPQVGFLYNNEMKKRPIDEFKTTVIDGIWIWAEVDYATAPIERAEFYYDGKLVFTDTEAPYKWKFDKFSLRKHQITVIVYDELGRESSDWREIRFINIFRRFN